ncbi:unnamed protein product [Calypogeia fissa]
MVFFAREDRDDDSLGTISDDSSTTPPDKHKEDEEHVNVSLHVSPDSNECKVEFLREGNEKLPKEKKAPEPDIDVLIKEAQDDLSVLKVENAELHQHILSNRQRRRRSIVDADMLEGQDFLYQSNLARWVELKEELDQLRQNYRNQFDEMHVQLKAIQAQAHEQEESLIHDLWEVAREAQNTVTGQILSDVVLKQLEDRDRAATAEASKVRIQARQLRSRLAKLESAKRKKDQLPGGLHLVDFEQLKMETESLAEKTGAKNEEIAVLRKKRTITVHSLSHVREKLQHVEKDTKVANEKLELVERKLHHGRIELCNLKARCEQILRKKGNMQKSMVNITDPLLLDDLENLKEDAEATEETLKELRSHYKGLNEESKKSSIVNLQISKDGRTSTKPDSETSSKHDLRWGAPRDRMWRQQVS